MKTRRRERVAAIAHEAWSGWIRYMYSKCSPMCDAEGRLIGLLIPQGLVERWTRQMNSSYKDLSEAEKESDRVEADRYIMAVERNAT